MAKRKSSSKAKRDSKALVKQAKKKSIKCKARVKTCSKCKHRFEAGDKSWHCPECGKKRNCKNNALLPYQVCRVHGAGGGRPPLQGKLTIPSKHVDRFNAILKDPELMSLSYEIALSETRADELLLKMHENDLTAVQGDIFAIVRSLEYDVLRLHSFLEKIANYPTEKGSMTPSRIRKLVPEHGFQKIFNKIVELKAVIEPLHIEATLWRDINFQNELTRKLNDTERKWASAHDQLVPVSMAYNAIRVVMRDALTVIISPKDRGWLAKRIKGYLGE